MIQVENQHVLRFCGEKQLDKTEKQEKKKVIRLCCGKSGQAGAYKAM